MVRKLRLAFPLPPPPIQSKEVLVLSNVPTTVGSLKHSTLSRIPSLSSSRSTSSPIPSLSESGLTIKFEFWVSKRVQELSL